MGNISIKINMTQLKHIKKEFTGKEGNKVLCLVIPIDENKMFQGEKGVYLDITAIEIKNKNGDSKDTHLLKQSFSKDVYEAMSQDERESYPILGNAIQWGRQEANPVQSNAISESAVDAYNDSKTEEHDDLPF
jgi:hypothetical protein